MQQINLFNPALIARKEWLDARLMAIAFGLLVVAMLIGYFSSYQTLAPLQAQADASTAELDQLQAELDALILRQDLQSTDNSLQNELASIKSKLQQTENLLALTGLNMDSSSSGHLAVMKGLARQHTAGIWLTGVESSVGKQLRIQGRTLSPDLVPTYIANLGNDEAFSGRTFATLNLSVGKAEAEASLSDQPDQAPVSREFFEFTLQSALPESAVAGVSE